MENILDDVFLVIHKESWYCFPTVIWSIVIVSKSEFRVYDAVDGNHANSVIVILIILKPFYDVEQ